MPRGSSSAPSARSGAISMSSRRLLPPCDDKCADGRRSLWKLEEQSSATGWLGRWSSQASSTGAEIQQRDACREVRSPGARVLRARTPKLSCDGSMNCFLEDADV